jgi:hypothetical protein
MSPPRPIEPGTTFFITVRAVNRSFRFVPKPDVVASIDFTFKADSAKTAFPAGTWLMRLVHNVRCEALACA